MPTVISYSVVELDFKSIDVSTQSCFLSRTSTCPSSKDWLFTFILPLSAIIFLYQSVTFGKIDLSFLLLPTKSHFPLLNVDFYRPEPQNKSRNRPWLEAAGLSLYNSCCSNLNRTSSSYIFKAGKAEGFGSCHTLPPTQSLSSYTIVHVK